LSLLRSRESSGAHLQAKIVRNRTCSANHLRPGHSSQSSTIITTKNPDRHIARYPKLTLRSTSSWNSDAILRTTGCDGKNGARCFFTPIGPIPGPPPPWGMQNVLCRFRWHTSAPMCPGLVRPTCTHHRGHQRSPQPSETAIASVHPTLPTEMTGITSLASRHARFPRHRQARVALT
jgi:hypothetical protein